MCRFVSLFGCFFFLSLRRPPRFTRTDTLFPYTTLCRSRKGVAPDDARTIIRTNTTVIGAMAVHRGEADALLCGAIGQYDQHLPHIVDVLGLRPGAQQIGRAHV